MKLHRLTSSTFFQSIKTNLLTFLAGLVFVLFVVITLWGDSGALKLLDLRHKKEDLANKNFSLLQENLRLTQEIKKLNDPYFIELEARSRLGFVRPNDMIFTFSPEQKQRADNPNVRRE